MKIKLKIITAISFICFGASVFAQNQAVVNPPKTESKGILDLVNEKIGSQVEEEKAKREAELKKNGTSETEDLSKYYNTPGADYERKIINGLEDYKGRKDELQQRLEELKLEREAKIKQQVELEAKLREEALRQAEINRINQLRYEEAKRKAEASAPKQKSSTTSSTETKKRKVIKVDQDYYDKQRKMMESQSY